MIQIQTGSRLHFGLFSVPSEHAGPWLNQEGQPAMPRRSFGGVGLMIDRPGIEITVSEAEDWSAEGPLADRALSFAQSYCRADFVNQAFAIRIESAAPEHAGLGTGTQLGLAVATAIAKLTGRSALDAALLARKIGRGHRSAIGVHGFQRGGFLVEAGKTRDDELSPLLLQNAFPDDWTILLITPCELQGMHGSSERDAFRDLAHRLREDPVTESLCRIVLLGMLPAFASSDLVVFGEALYDFNRRVGELFRPVQGGLYAHPRVERIIKNLRDLGVRGVGQSSWGPTIFAVRSSAHSADLRDHLVSKQIATADEIMVACPFNRGAEVSP